MVGRNVRHAWTGATGEVIRWEPFGAAMTDVLVRHEDGTECWYGSGSLQPVDGLGPLPDRWEEQKIDREQSILSLQQIRANHVRDFHKSWPGMEFGKAHFGMMIDGALAELKRDDD
jgi:hypothetical protein